MPTVEQRLDKIEDYLKKLDVWLGDEPASHCKPKTLMLWINAMAPAPTEHGDPKDPPEPPPPFG